MKDYTIKEIIQIIPIEESLQKELLKDFDSYPEEKKLGVTQLCWSVFDELEDVVEEQCRTRIMEQIASGELKTEDMQEAVHDAMDKEYEERLSGKRRDEQKIDVVRHQIEQLLQKA